MRRLDGIYITISDFAANPEVRRKGGIGIMLGILLGSLALFISNAQVNATIAPIAAREGVAASVISYHISDSPTFLIKTDGLVQETNQKQETSTFTAEKGKITTTLLNNTKDTITSLVYINSEPAGNDTFRLTLPATQQFTPGKLTLSVQLSFGSKTQTVTQDFTWGVLALNFDQSTYKVNEKATIGMAVLDDNGRTLCDARLSLNAVQSSQAPSYSTSQK